jgi:hypothetical protein
VYVLWEQRRRCDKLMVYWEQRSRNIQKVERRVCFMGNREEAIKRKCEQLNIVYGEQRSRNLKNSRKMCMSYGNRDGDVIK